jgi:hypothetical protein
MKKIIYMFFLSIFVMACRKPYTPPAITGNGNYLVVAGVINSGADSTIIKLSRTVNVSNKTTANAVLNAIVTVEDDQNISFSLTDAGNGNYVSAGLNLDNSRTYRLRIKTSDNKQYLSDLVPVKITPPIDSVGYNIITVPNTGIQIYASTHDPKNSTRYYRWDYTEDWEFHSKYISNFISDGSGLVLRSQDQYVSTCYSNDVSSDIPLGSSAKLTQDLLYQYPILFISDKSEKIESRYRLVLREYALTNSAYNFWINLKKNTEQLGSIFDAQPSELQSNIHCVSNPSEPVIGYLSICTVSSKTEFINNAQLPAWEPAYPYTCNVDTAVIGKYNYHNLVTSPDLFLATDPIGTVASPTGYLWTTRECADCSTRGSLIRPPFWR